MFAQESGMDIQKENTKYLASLLANCGATQDEINDLSFDDEVGFFESNRLADWFVSQINFGWRVWQVAKAQAVPDVQQALNDRLLVRSIKEQVESHIAEISVNDLFDKGWFAAMKCIQSNIDMLEAREQSHE